MKQCPVCEKTFDDSLRFCQVDGTPLVDLKPYFASTDAVPEAVVGWHAKR